MANSILSQGQITEALSALPGWSYSAPNIVAEYKFASFRDAIAFIVQVAFQADALDHHPELHNVYNKVSFSCARMTPATRSPRTTSSSPRTSAKQRRAS